MNHRLGMVIALIALLIGFLAVLGILIGSQFGYMSGATATIWVSGATALATLAAVAAALWGASAAAYTAKEAEAQANAATRRADDEAIRSELIRHEAVRPVASIRSFKCGTQYFAVGFDHESGGPGFEMQGAVVMTANGQHIWLRQPPTGGILRPRQEALLHPDLVDINSAVAPLRFERNDVGFQQNDMVSITCYFRDSIGWWWKQESLPVHLNPEHEANTGKPFEDHIALQMPVHIKSAPDTTLGIRI